MSDGDKSKLLVTGATGAVGGALVQLAGAAGWNVVGIYHRGRDRAEALRRAWAGAPQALSMCGCDLSDPVEVQTLLAALTDSYCPDALVHLAAPKIDVQPIQRVQWDAYQHQFDVTLKPLVLLARPVVKRMARQGRGRVITALSAVVLGMPPRGFASYTAAKYALAGYMKCLAVEYAGRGIAVNMVSPGPMRSDMLQDLPDLLTDQMRESIPGGQWIDPNSVAKAIFWLASDAAPEVTGCNLPLTSGMVF
jgi:3-oxoacyl-[acyl-carrier protein] reductase